MDENKYTQFISDTVKAIVQNPDDVKVEKTTDEQGVLLTLTTNPQDMGLVIGRGGETAKAIRTLLRTVGMKEGARVFLKIVDPRKDVSSE